MMNWDGISHFFQIPLAWFRDVDRRANLIPGSPAIIINRNDPNGTVIGIDTEQLNLSIDLDDYDFVTTNTQQTISAKKVFTAPPSFETTGDGYYTFSVGGEAVGRLVATATAFRIRAYSGADNTGILLDHGGSNGEARQLLENPPASDTISHASAQIATRGWVNANFLRSVPDLSNYVALAGAQTITGKKTFTTTPVFSTSGDGYYNFLSGGEVVGRIVVTSSAIRFRCAYGDTNGGIFLDNGGTAGTPRQLIENPPVEDSTSTSSAQIATRGWVNDKFLRLDKSLTGFVYATNGTASVKSFGTAAGTIAEGNHTHAQYLEQADVAEIAASVSASAISTFAEEGMIPAMSDELAKYVTLATAQTITAAKTFTNNTTIRHGSNFGAAASYRSLVFNDLAGELAARLESYVSASGESRFRLYANRPTATASGNGSIGVTIDTNGDAQAFAWAKTFVAGPSGKTATGTAGFMEYNAATAALYLYASTAEPNGSGRVVFQTPHDSGGTTVYDDLTLRGNYAAYPSTCRIGTGNVAMLRLVNVPAVRIGNQDSEYTIFTKSGYNIHTAGTYTQDAVLGGGSLYLSSFTSGYESTTKTTANLQTKSLTFSFGDHNGKAEIDSANDFQISGTGKLRLSKHPAITDKTKTTTTNDAESLQIATVGYVNESGGAAEDPGNYTIKATSSGEGASTANTAAWTVGQRPSGATVDFGVEVTIQTRTYYDHMAATPVLYGFYRTLKYDNKGRLYSVSAETRYEIDTPIAG